MAKKVNSSTKHFEEQFGRREPKKPFMPKGSENWQENAGFKKVSNKGEGNYEDKKIRKPGAKPFGADTERKNESRTEGAKPFGRAFNSNYADKKYGDRKAANSASKEGSFGARKPNRDTPYGERRNDSRDARPENRRGGDRNFGDKKFGDKPFGRSTSDGRKAFGDKPFGEKKFGDKPFTRSTHEGRKPFGEKSFSEKKYTPRTSESAERKPFTENKYGKKFDSDRPVFNKDQPKERKFDKHNSYDRNAVERKPKFADRDEKDAADKPKKDFNKSSFKKPFDGDNEKKNDKNFAIKKITLVDNIEIIDTYQDEYITHSHNKREHRNNDSLLEEQMPLNKYVSRCGVCGRREAAALIKDGRIKVNAKVEPNPAYKVLDKDVVTYNDKKLTMQHNLVYVLLNKPKDFITTSDDPEGRKTVMDLVANAVDERIYPVGRLDRNTSGLLLLTNDGELAQKMSHPKYAIKKLYQVNLDKMLTKPDFEKILGGLTLEDGIVNIDQLAYIDAADKTKIGIEIHSGRNRIVRRIFESLGYVVKQLDRVMYANLTKKNLPRGKWRFLSESEVRNLKHYN